MQRLVSAVITTYGRYYNDIKRSINSVKNQTYKNIEIVLVDDNHPESEYRSSIIEGLTEEKGILYIQHEKNMGAQAARNTGIRSCHGEIVAFFGR